MVFRFYKLSVVSYKVPIGKWLLIYICEVDSLMLNLIAKTTSYLKCFLRKCFIAKEIVLPLDTGF